MNRLSLLFSAIFCFVSFTLFAQISQNRIMVGGNVGFLYLDNTPNTIGNSITFSPSAGYFITDGLALGLGLVVNSNTATNQITSSITNTLNLGIQPFARYYSQIADRFFWFGNTSFSFSQSRLRVNNPNQPAFTTPFESRFQFNAGAGLAFFPSENFQVEMLYNAFYLIGGENGTEAVGIGFNTFNPSIGFRYFF